jgi:hypothetical protein
MAATTIKVWGFGMLSPDLRPEGKSQEVGLPQEMMASS